MLWNVSAPPSAADDLLDELFAEDSEARQIDAAIDSDPAGWIQRNFWIPEISAPIVLHPSQEVPLAEALRRDAEGSFVYSTVLWGAIKKSAKSSIAAAVGMWFAWRRRNSSIKVLGNDLDQAQSRVFEYMRRAVALNPAWRSVIQVTQTKITLPNGSVIKAIPVDPQGEAGGGDDLLLYTELWGWKSRKHQQMWSESTLSPLLYGQSMRWCESYAGYKGESPVLEQLYESGVKSGRVLDSEHELYANDAGRLFVLWNTKPTLPWQTDEYYQQEEASLTPTEFERLHRNQWGNSSGGLFNTASITVVDAAPECKQIGRFYDLAVTAKKHSDYTVGLKLGITADEQLVILHVYRAQKEFPDVKQAIVQNAAVDGRHVRLRLEAEKAGLIGLQELLRDPLMRGYTIDAVPPVGDKYSRALPVASRVNGGRVLMVRADWNRAFLDELAVFPVGSHDDQVDALSGAYDLLVKPKGFVFA